MSTVCPSFFFLRPRLARHLKAIIDGLEEEEEEETLFNSPSPSLLDSVESLFPTFVSSLS
jgi:hypothetical protein